MLELKLIKPGKYKETRKLLEPFIEANLQKVSAWLLEVETLATMAEEKRSSKDACTTTPMRFKSNGLWQGSRPLRTLSLPQWS